MFETIELIYCPNKSSSRFYGGYSNECEATTSSLHLQAPVFRGHPCLTPYRILILLYSDRVKKTVDEHPTIKTPSVSPCVLTFLFELKKTDYWFTSNVCISTWQLKVRIGVGGIVIYSLT